MNRSRQNRDDLSTLSHAPPSVRAARCSHCRPSCRTTTESASEKLTSCHSRDRLPAEHAGAPASPPPRLLERVRTALRTRHYSGRTEKAYVGWIRRFILFHDKRHPDNWPSPRLSRSFRTWPTRQVSASTQNQALAALLFLYQDVLGGSSRGSTTSSAGQATRALAGGADARPRSRALLERLAGP